MNKKKYFFSYTKNLESGAELFHFFGFLEGPAFSSSSSSWLEPTRTSKSMLRTSSDLRSTESSTSSLKSMLHLQLSMSTVTDEGVLLLRVNLKISVVKVASIMQRPGWEVPELEKSEAWTNFVKPELAQLCVVELHLIHTKDE